MKKLFIIMLCLVLVFSFTGCSNIEHPYVQEYIAGQGNIKGNVNTADFYERDERFEIGATKEGYAVFKNPEAAYNALLDNYSEGLTLIRDAFDLDPVSQKDFQFYKKYGWQVNTGTDVAIEQAHFITLFFDIYENSFN